MRMTAAEAARLTGARIRGDAAVVLTGAEVDSRRIGPGDLFVALPGERVDGHRFVGEALRTGAAALVRGDADLPSPPPGRALLEVEDTLPAYHALAAAERRRAGWRVAAVTGSVGKTTVKEMLATLLAARFRTGASAGNRNSTLGLPAEILSQPEDLEVFVAEMGMSHAGELDTLAALVAPDLLLYTRIAAAHTEFFADLDAVAEAKAEALAHVRDGGTVVLNAADPRQAGFASRCSGVTVLRYGPGEDADVRLEAVHGLGLEGSRMTVRVGGDRAELHLHLAGRHQVENGLAALAAAWALGVPLGEAATAAAALRPAPHRGEVLRLGPDLTVVDDSYNASPAAVRAALALLAETTGRRVAVLGEMLELGSLAGKAHREAGRQAAARADILLAVGGPPAVTMARAAREAGLTAAEHVPDAETALERLRTLLEPGDVVLVKGSRGIGLDRVVAGLAGDERGA